MPKLFHIIRHEFKLAAANKAYVILTLLGPFLILAVTVLPSLLSQSAGAMSGGKPVAVLGASESVKTALSEAFSRSGIELLQAETTDQAREDLNAGSTVGFLFIEQGWPDSGKAIWYSSTGAEYSVFGVAQGVLEAKAREMRIAASGLDPVVLSGVLAPPVFEVVKIENDGKEETKTQETFMQVLFTAMSFIMLIYMTVLLYGQMIGRSVVLEKTSKTVEVMLSSITSRELMFGKIFGLGLAGILQYGVWVTMALLLTKFIGPFFNIALPPGLSAGNLLWLVVFFILAFFLYASAYAALGAASEDEHHLGQLAWPLLMFLIVPLVMIGALVSSPNSTVAVVLSLFPLTSPIVMLLRILVAPPEAWQIALCIGLLIVSVFGMALFAAKIFRIGMLMTGKRPKISEILRWALVK